MSTADNSTKVLWTPSEERIANANMTRFKESIEQRYSVKLNNYEELHRWSVENSEAFWSAMWMFAGLELSHPWDSIVRNGNDIQKAEWFPGARLNFAENLLRHSGNKSALVFHSENGNSKSIGYSDLRKKVAQLAAALKEQGVQVGDRVAGYMPNMIETIVGMLATTSIGAIWSSCSPDFGIHGVLDRFGQIEPKVLLSADGYFYNGKTIDCVENVVAITKAIPSLKKVVIIPYVEEEPYLNGSDLLVSWQEFLVTDNTPELVFEQLPFDHPLYIMYSSGTTGAPKCIVHGAGGTLLQHAKEHLLHVDLKPEDTLFYFTTCGWMMWNWLVSGLTVGATLVLYDGAPSYPSMDSLLNLIEEEGITVFGTSAKFISALEKAEIKPKENHDLSRVKAVLSTGSPLSHESFEYIYREFKEDVCLSSISGGTDIISCFILGNPTLPVHVGQLQCAGLGMDVKIYNDEGQPLGAGEGKGELVCTTSFPSRPIMFWNDPKAEKYTKAYFNTFEGVWAHGDYAEITPEKGFIIHGRSDAVLNPGGVRIGTAEIYRQVEKIETIQESLVVGQDWEDDVRVILFVKLKDDVELTDELQKEIRLIIKENATPRHVPARIVAVDDIPRTISGKIVELAVRNLIHGRPVKNKDALANPEALNQFENIPELQD